MQLTKSSGCRKEIWVSTEKAQLHPFYELRRPKGSNETKATLHAYKCQNIFLFTYNTSTIRHVATSSNNRIPPTSICPEWISSEMRKENINVTFSESE